jgi:hypothetical protein
MDDVLRYAWGQYRVWAATSRRLKSKITRASLLVLALTLSGTALGTMAPFLSLAAPLAQLLPWAAAAALGTAAYFTSELLADSARESWVKARALAEALKSECYLYVTHTAPFHTADAPQRLGQRTDALLQTAGGILAAPVSDADRAKGLPDGPWTIDDYVQKRVREQIDNFYAPAIARHAAAVRRGRIVAIAFGVASVLLSASTGGSLPGERAWVAALLGTVTTAAAAIAAWFQSGNHLQNALNYQSVVARLELLLAQRNTPGRLAHLVADAEGIFQAEHAAWLMQWQTSTPVEPSSPKGGQQG